MFVAIVAEVEEVQFLDFDLVCELQSGVLLPGQLRGTKGELHEGYLESALNRPLNAFYYAGERDLLVLASYIWHGVAEAHTFSDGNKRTATLSTAVFLEMNGVTFHDSVPADEIGHFVEGLYEVRRFTRDNLLGYLQTRCCWIEE